MKRKMIGAATAYMSGLFFASFFTKGSDLLLIAGLLPVFIIIFYLMKMTKTDIVIISVCFVFSFSSGVLYDHFVYEKIIAYNETVQNFCGKVTDVEFRDNNKTSYTLDGRINGGQKAKVTYYGDEYDVSYGDIMTLENCMFSIPDSDYIFDGESYYRSQGIFLQAEYPVSVEIEYCSVSSLRRSILAYRERIISDFCIRLGDTAGGFLSGIVFGETSNIDFNEKTLMYRCGIGHIMAVSGLHVSVIASLLLMILRKLRINRYVSFIILNVFIVLMIIMVKSPISAIRAAIMINFAYSAKLFRRQNDTLNSLSAAVLIICISDPIVIFNQGFLLSVAGTFGLGVFAPYMTAKMKSKTLMQRILKSFTAMICVMITVTSMNFLFFDEASVVTPVTNVLLIPICTVAMICGMIYVLTGGFISLLSVAEVCIKIVTGAAEKIGNLGFTHISCGSERIFVISMACMIFLMLVHAVFKNRKFTAIAMAAAVTVFIFSSSIFSISNYNKMRVAILGSSNNAAAVITYKGKSYVFDLSGHYRTSRYVRKYMNSNGISEIEFLFLANKVQSQLSTYTSDLELFDIECIYTVGNSDLSMYEKGNIKSAGDDLFTADCGSYSMNYNNGILEIEFFGMRICVVPSESRSLYSDCINIFYGNISDSSVISSYSQSIYLDKLDETLYKYSDMNNFEIIISPDSGGYKIRRM